MHGLDNRADRWFEAHPDGSSPVHFGGAYDNAFVRQIRGLDPYVAADQATLQAILDDARADLRNGFIGLHMQPEYTPGTAAGDLLAHAALAAEHGVPLCVHARYSDNLPPGTNLQAIGELVGAARETGAHVHVEHINSTGGTGVMAEALGRIGDAIDEGLSMTALHLSVRVLGHLPEVGPLRRLATEVRHRLRGPAGAGDSRQADGADLRRRLRGQQAHPPRSPCRPRMWSCRCRPTS